MCWVRVSGVGWVSWMVGRPVRVAGCKLAVADVRRDHELLSDHDVHGDEMTLEGLDAPVVLEIEQGLRLEDRVLQVSLNPLHPSNTLITSERPLLGMASSHGCAHMASTFVAGDEPVDNSAKHARVVLSKVVGTALLVLLLDGGTVVR